MRQFLVDEFSKFKIEVVELIQYVSKFKTLTMNVQTYLSINVLVLLGIEANIFMFSIPFDKTYNQEYYNILFYVGHTLYILFVCITNYMRLNYYKKDSLNWINVFIMISLVMVLFFGKSITISSSNFRFSSTTDYILGNKVLWSVDTPELFFPVNDTLRMYKNDDIRMYNFNCITDTIVEVITTCNTYTLLTVHLL